MPQEVLSNDGGLSKDTAAVAIFGLIDQVDTLFVRLCLDQCDHWPEDFFLCHTHIFCNAFQNSGRNKEAIFIFFRKFNASIKFKVIVFYLFNYFISIINYSIFFVF